MDEPDDDDDGQKRAEIRQAGPAIRPSSPVMPHVPCVCTMPHEVAAWRSFLHATFTFTSVDAA